ncbi:hypothetical protein BXY41_11684 [Lacrimispora xylanisolvens]|uniref:Uncharacterized protein n=1 Tax=Lacrimispora xylanisolvens TaxID=384636 RepID=A0A2S6HJ96_9FIRM|nr:hypothetical protein [Hungatella xylanolytica]PPK77545.1 hypothetical protein BXY41_11684 [Hungatella xylanolytica]
MVNYSIIQYETEKGIIKVEVKVHDNVITVKNLDNDCWQSPFDESLEFDMCETSRINDLDSNEMLAILDTLRGDFDCSIITGSETQPNTINFLDIP